MERDLKVFRWPARECAAAATPRAQPDSPVTDRSQGVRPSHVDHMVLSARDCLPQANSPSTALLRSAGCTTAVRCLAKGFSMIGWKVSQPLPQRSTSTCWLSPVNAGRKGEQWSAEKVNTGRSS